MKNLLIAFTLLISCFIAAAQPTWKNITDTHSIRKIVTDGELVWLSSEGGLICINTTTADTSYYNNANSGMPFTEISDMCPDNQGRLWLTSSWGGIACKDGDIWTTYNTTNTDLPSNRAYSITFDSEGVLWAGFSQNLVRFDGTSWTTYDLEFMNLSNFGPDYLAVDTNNRILIAGYGLWAFDGNSFIHYDTANSPIQDNRISCLKSFPDGKTWIGHNFNGLTITDFTTWEVFDTLVPGKALNSVSSFDRTPEGKTWLGTYAGDLYAHDGNAWSLTIPGPPVDTLQFISYLEAGNDNNLYIGAITTSRFDGNSWFNVNTTESAYRGNQVDDILHTSGHSTWIANYNGMTRFTDNEITLFNGDDSSAYLAARCYAEDHTGKIYAGHYGGISVFSNNAWHRVSIPGHDFFSTMYPNSMCVDQDNNLWIATFPGVIRFDGTHATYYSYYLNNFPAWEVFCLDIDQSGRVIAGFNGGIAVWDGTEWTTNRMINPPVTDDKVWDLCMIDNYMMMATSGGLVRYDGLNWEYYTPENSPLPESFVPTLDLDSNDILWCISGINNLVRYDGLNWQIQTFFETGMLYGPQRMLRIDHLNNLWMGGFDCAISIYNENGIYLNTPEMILPQTGQQIINLVYPNPATDEIKISYNLPDQQPGWMVNISDLGGKTIDRFPLSEKEGIINYSAGKLPSGQYLISITEGNSNVATSKIQVIR